MNTRFIHRFGLTDAVLALLHETLKAQPDLRSQDLVGLVEAHFGVSVHPRSIERALARQEKKR